MTRQSPLATPACGAQLDSYTGSMRRPFVLGRLSGALIGFGLSMIAWYLLFHVFLHHMFIVGASPSLVVLGALPPLFVIAGTVFAARVLARKGSSS